MTERAQPARDDGRGPRPRLRSARARGLERVVDLVERDLQSGAVADARERADVRAGIEYLDDLLVWFRTDGGGAP